MNQFFDTIYRIWTSIALILSPNPSYNQINESTTLARAKSLEVSSIAPIQSQSPTTRRINEAIRVDQASVLSTYRANDGNCDRRYFNNNSLRIVCACSKDFCDNYELEWPEQFGQIIVYQSSEEGKRFERQTVKNYDLPVLASSREIIVDIRQEHQTIMGWGGGFTDAFGANVLSLSPEVRSKLMEAYFGKNGSRYNFGRVPMGSTDYSPRMYTYDESEEEPDFELEHFKVAPEEYKFKMPLIKEAMQIAKSIGQDFKLFLSPWGVPKWMTQGHDYYAARLIDNSTVYQCQAEAYVKFLNAYRDNGIQFWGGTVQNEPIKLVYTAFIPIAGVIFCNDEMRRFIGQYLGPTLAKHGYNKNNFKLMVGDDVVGVQEAQIQYIMDDPDVQKYVSGLAYHFYYSGNYVPYSVLSELWSKIESKMEFMLMTEATENVLKILGPRADPGDWLRGQHYASDIIEDLLRDTNGWVDWNLALDIYGGPSYMNNTVDASILIDKTKDEFYKLPTYYTLSHFSRFFRPGSIRVNTTAKDENIDDVGRDLMHVAVRDKQSGHLILNILNRAEYRQKVGIQLLGLNDQEYEIDPIIMDALSINTVLIKID